MWAANTPVARRSTTARPVTETSHAETMVARWRRFRWPLRQPLSTPPLFWDPTDLFLEHWRTATVTPEAFLKAPSGSGIASTTDPRAACNLGRSIRMWIATRGLVWAQRQVLPLVRTG